MDVKIKYHLLVVGAGGTGSFFLKEVSRYIASLPNSMLSRIGGMYVCDGDIVEEKNLERQSFLAEDIGMNKAAVMAEVLNDNFFSGSCTGNLHWEAIASFLTERKQLSFLKKTDSSRVHIPVIIGCVDNHACRLLLEDFFSEQENCVLFDSANEWSNGEVVFAYKLNGRVVGHPRSHYFPDIKEGDVRSVTEMSCTELNMVAPQHIFTNMWASMLLLSKFCSLIEQNDMKPGMSVFDRDTLSTDFYGATPKGGVAYAV